MGAISNLLESAISRRATSGTYRPAQWFIDCITGGEESSSGLRINHESALKYTPFWAAVRIISGTVGSLPFITYKRMAGDNKERFPKHTVYKLLHDRPNDYMDSLTFTETRQAHVLTHGNGYAEIQRDGAGRPVALWPLLPDKVERKLNAAGEPFYTIKLPDNTTADLPDYNVLHIKGLGFDGFTGYDVVSYHKEAIGYGVAVKQFGSRFFGNDASPGGVLEHPNTLSQEAFGRLKKSWLEKHQGLSNAHRIQILEEGMKFNKTIIDPAQAQALEVQKYTVDDCSRIFNIPPHMLGSMEFSKYNNVEQLELEFIKRTMLYWFRKWELECNYKLFMPAEYGNLFCEILYEGLLRGDIKTRYECYNIGRNGGWLSANDIRKKENMNTIGPDGDIYLEPLNMKPAGSKTPDPSAGEPDPASADPVRSAHRALITSQWLRIIKKQNGNLQKNRNNALTILSEPVIAYASTMRKQQSARAILEGFINEIISDGTKYTEYDAANLAEMTLQRIGGEDA